MRDQPSPCPRCTPGANERKRTEFADFNTCVYASETLGEPKHKKPQRFAGRLKGLGSLSAQCRCGEGAVHPAVDSSNSPASARYPRALCVKYAQLLVATWLDDVDMEEPVAEAAGSARAVPEAEWKGGEGKYGGLRPDKSKKAERDRENKAALGGLRRPIWAVERLPGLRDAGWQLSSQALRGSFGPERLVWPL